MKDTERTFMLTDGCMWEQNKEQETCYPHAVEVVDMETGQVRYIRSGSRIRFVEGDITLGRDQKSYNEQENPTEPILPSSPTPLAPDSESNNK